MRQAAIKDKRRRYIMGKKIVVVNAGPRKGWSTDTLITEAAKGAESKGAEIEKFDLYDLDRYTGCISCFGCKTEKFEGRCICRDGLTPVLDAIREADGLIIGTPNYLGETSASFRALYERLIFQYITYRTEEPCCNDRKIPVLLVMTSNAQDKFYQPLLKNYQETLSAFVGPTEILSCGETLQVKDYSRFNWNMFNGDERQERRETVFPGQCEKAFGCGVRMASN